MTSTKPLTEKQKEQFQNYYAKDYTDKDRAKHFVLIIKGTLSPQIKWKIDSGYNFDIGIDDCGCHYLEFFYKE